MFENLTDIQQEYIAKLINIVEGDLRHPEYESNLEIAKFSSDMTCDMSDDYIEQFKMRESIDQLEQRKNLYKSLTGFAVKQIMSFYKRILSIEPQTNILLTELVEDETNLMNKASNFNKGQDLLTYIYNLLEKVLFNDPNALLLINSELMRNDSGAIVEVKPYPTIFFSPEIIYRENTPTQELDFAVIEREREEMTLDTFGRVKTEKVKDFYLFRKGFNLVLRQYKNVEPESDLVIEIKKKKYFIEIDNTKVGGCPLLELGVYCNQKLGATNYVSPLPKQLFIDLINTKSELDLARILHVFMQRVQYANPCMNENESGHSCEGGLIGDQICTSCNGTGIDINHQSSADVLYIKMPEDGEKVVDIRNLVSYVQMDFKPVEHMTEYIEGILDKISTSIFGYNIFQRLDPVQTAAQVDFESSKIRSTLTPFASKLSSLYVDIIKLIASYSDIEGVICEYNYPKNMRLESKTELLNCYSVMKNAGLSNHLLESVELDLLNKMYQNQPYVAKDIQAYECHRPFKNMSSEERVFTLGTLPLNHPTRVLYSYFDQIVLNIKKTVTVPFSQTAFDRQKALIKIEVDKIIDTLPSATDFEGSVLPFDNFATEDELEESDLVQDVEAAQTGSKLLETVGGVQGIINISKAVSDGTMTESAAESLLVEVFGFTAEAASKLIDIPAQPSE